MRITKTLAAFLLVLLAGPTLAQTSGTVTVRAKADGVVAIEIVLPKPLPYRVLLLDQPRRLVLDFQGVLEFGLPEQGSAAISGLRSGRFEAGWTRIVADLARPLAVQRAELKSDINNGSHSVEIYMKPVSSDEYAQRSVPLNTRTMPTPEVSTATARAPRRGGEGALLIALDPGHGGIDPGANRNGVTEKAIALEFALELQRQLQASSRYDVFLTRSGDDFVSLRDRVTKAQAAQAAVLISIHANTVTKGRASGAAVYVMGPPGDDAEAAATAALENNSDAVSGLTAEGTETDILRVLTDMARVETNARSALLARDLIEGLRASVGVIRSRPNRAAEFRVLRAPDVPSVLLELGFLSDAGDLADLSSPQWRALAAKGIVQALDAWVAADAEAARLARQ